MKYLGDYAEDYATLNFKFSTHKADGTPITLAGTPAVSVYKGSDVAQSTAGITLGVDFDGVTGLHNVLIDLSSNAFYAVGQDYSVVITTGTVDSVSVVGTVLATFSIENRNEKAAMTKIIGTALTETSAGYLAAGVKKFFDVATPVGTINLIAANLTQILGTALTETAGLLAGGFKKFFNVAAPTATCLSLPDAVPGASGGLPTTNGTKVSQTVDLTSGQSIAASSVPAVTLANGAHGGAGATITLQTPIAATVPDNQKVDLNTIKTQALTCGAATTILASVGAPAAPGANGGMPTTNGTKLNQTVDLTAGQTVAATVAGSVGSVAGNVTGSVGSVASFGTLVADIATAIWGAATRTLSAFGFTVAATVADKTGYALAVTPAPASTALSNATWTDGKAAFLDASISGVDTVVDALATTLGVAGAGLTSVPNSAGVSTLLTRVPDTISLAAVNAEVDTALNTAIPGSPTANSINERVAAIDDLTQASGGGDLASIKTQIGTAGAGLTVLATAAALATVDGVADAIKLKTDLIPASPAAVGSAMTLTAAERIAIDDAILKRKIVFNVGGWFDVYDAAETSVVYKIVPTTDAAALPIVGTVSAAP